MSDPTLPGQDVATLVATSLENIKPTLIDNLSEDNAFFWWLNQNGRVDYEDGGYVISEPLMYAGNNTVKSYYPGDYYQTERPSGFTRLSYEWGFIGGTFTIDGPTKFMNSGKYGIINLVTGYIDQLKISFAQTMSTMFLGDGTGNNGADLHGLELLLDTSAAWSTVGGIDSDANAWWRNYYEDASGTNWGAGAAAYPILRIKHGIKVTSKPGYGKADAVMTSLDQYELYERALMASISYMMPSMADAKMAEAGFGGIRVDGIPIMYDSELDTHATAAMQNTWFILNSKCLRLVVGKNKAFEVRGPVEHPLKDAELFKANMYAQLTVRGRRDSLGRILASATYA